MLSAAQDVGEGYGFFRQPGKFASLNGNWLALQCRLDDEVDVPYELQLYRVDG